MALSRFKITADHLKVASLIADGSYTFGQIEEMTGFSTKRIRNWMNDQPLFQAEIEKAKARVKGGLTKARIAEKLKRLEVLEDLLQRAERVILERGADESMADVPGGKTGLLVRDYKGNSYTPVYKADVGLMKEIREVLKQGAIEVGDWTEKKELSGPDGGAIPVSIEQAINKAYGESDESTTEADRPADEGCAAS